MFSKHGYGIAIEGDMFYSKQSPLTITMTMADSVYYEQEIA